MKIQRNDRICMLSALIASAVGLLLTPMVTNADTIYARSQPVPRSGGEMMILDREPNLPDDAEGPREPTLLQNITLVPWFNGEATFVPPRLGPCRLADGSMTLDQRLCATDASSGVDVGLTYQQCLNSNGFRVRHYPGISPDAALHRPPNLQILSWVDENRNSLNDVCEQQLGMALRWLGNSNRRNISIGPCRGPATQNLVEEGDFFYWTCDEELIDRFWREFEFDNFPYNHDPAVRASVECDPTRPFTKLLSALNFLFKHRGLKVRPRAVHPNVQPSLSYYHFVARASWDDEERAGRGDDPEKLTFKRTCERGSNATTNVLIDRVELKYRFFYEEDVALRAATLVHEAAHLWYQSFWTDGASLHEECPAGRGTLTGHDACDYSYDPTGRANAYSAQVKFLKAIIALGSRVPRRLRVSARERAREILDKHFVVIPSSAERFLPPIPQ